MLERCHSRRNRDILKREDDPQLSGCGVFRYSLIPRQWIPSLQKSISRDPCACTHSWPECPYMTFGRWICLRSGKGSRSRNFSSAQVRQIRRDELPYPPERSFVGESCWEKHSNWIGNPKVILKNPSQNGSFENENSREVTNRTVHAAALQALFRTERGYRFYFGVYVRGVSWVTPLYMRLIDPFRRWVVYPAIFQRLQETWIEVYGPSASQVAGIKGR